MSSNKKIGTCAICGREFEKKTCRHQTCSKGCSKELKRRNARARGLWRSEEILYCDLCGKEFHPCSDTQRFCSHKCAMEYLRKMRKAKSGPMEETFWNDLDYTPGCEGPASPAYCPLEQRLGAEIW
jgi:predicted nucleic acid-binding Zn ribbon protein